MNYQELEKHCDKWFGTNGSNTHHIAQIKAAMLDLLVKAGCPIEANEIETVIAIDKCVMKNDGIPSLTIGKKYKVIWQNKKVICIIDDERVDHQFEKDTLSQFFYLP